MHVPAVAFWVGMKFLSRALFLLFLLLGVLIAVSNTERTELSLWPIPHTVVLPLYLLVIALLLVGESRCFGWCQQGHVDVIAGSVAAFGGEFCVGARRCVATRAHNDFLGSTRDVGQRIVAVGIRSRGCVGSRYIDPRIGDGCSASSRHPAGHRNRSRGRRRDVVIGRDRGVRAA